MNLKSIKVGGFNEPLSGSGSFTKLEKLPNVPIFNPNFQNQPRCPRKKLNYTLFQ